MQSILMSGRKGEVISTLQELLGVSANRVADWSRIPWEDQVMKVVQQKDVVFGGPGDQGKPDPEVDLPATALGAGCGALGAASDWKTPFFAELEFQNQLEFDRLADVSQVRVHLQGEVDTSDVGKGLRGESDSGGDVDAEHVGLELHRTVEQPIRREFRVQVKGQLQRELRNKHGLQTQRPKVLVAQVHRTGKEEEVSRRQERVQIGRKQPGGQQSGPHFHDRLLPHFGRKTRKNPLGEEEIHREFGCNEGLNQKS